MLQVPIPETASLTEDSGGGRGMPSIAWHAGEKHAKAYAVSFRPPLEFISLLRTFSLSLTSPLETEVYGLVVNGKRM